MTSAEREARDRAFDEWLDDPSPISTPGDPIRAGFDGGFPAGAEYARGATVAEIVEDLRETASTPEPNGVMANADLHYAANYIEARFSPAPPEREDAENVCVDDYPEHDFEAQDARDGITTLVCRRCGAETWEEAEHPGGDTQ